MNDSEAAEQLADAIVEESTTAKCGHWVECSEICERCYRCLDCCDCGKTNPRPSNFKKHPYGSVTNNSESETIARNIMVILSRTGDTFRSLSWEEYRDERKKDGNFTEREKAYFNKVVPWCQTAEQAVTFSPAWS